MKRIDKKYAIIYIDSKGETLEMEDEERICDDFATYDMISDYYNLEGFLQWNVYLIVPREKFEFESDIKEFEDNDKYVRKYAVSSDKIGRFVEKNFPDMGTDVGKIKLIHTKNHKESKAALKSQQQKSSWFLWESSFNRDLNIFDTLSKLDEVRVKLIQNPHPLSPLVIFCTHIDGEFSLAEKKFKLFC